MYKCIEQAEKFAEKISILDGQHSYTYRMLIDASASMARNLLNGKDDLNEDRVAYMVDPGFDYVKVQWAIWRAGGVAVPLCLSYPFPSLKYVLEDTCAIIIVASSSYKQMFEEYASENGIRLIGTDESLEDASVHLPFVDDDRRAMILYTSGTTSLPKGVASTHANIQTQVTTLISAWEWSSHDSTICVLPLHHVHGIINVVACSLYAGATCEFVSGFSAEALFNIFLSGRINVFMAVPTIYFKLIAYWESLDEQGKLQIKDTFQQFRLMVCGSAALPVSILEKWEVISGHTLLERYGMTEIGMAISNPYKGERRAGHVGIPLPGVDVRLVDENALPVEKDQPGEIQIKGGNVFREYWNREQATKDSFTSDGWFKTGDVAVLENGYYRILGRNSVDIIKSGGYKISALEIEEVLRTHPSVSDCAVVGIENDEWGELVAAAVIQKETIDTIELNSWMRTQMAAYKTPRIYKIVNELPRNAMGKVVKNDVKKIFI